MNINLANIDFCPGGKSATLTETTAEILLSETEKVIVPPEGTDGFYKVTITHAPVEESVSATITETGTHTITPSEGFGAMFGVNVDVNIPSVTDDKIQYFNRKPTADDAGLKAIGWTDDDVNYYKYNNYVYPWEVDNCKVNDANKQITINSVSDIATYKDKPYFKYCPMFDTSNVNSANNMFSGCEYIKSIPLLNTSNVVTMYVMFKNCKSLTSIPLLDTHLCTDMSWMFSYCSSLTSIPQLDTSNVKDMGGMFRGCLSLTSIPLLDTHSVTNMGAIFADCSSLTSIPQLDTSKVEYMNEMFSGCASLPSVPRLDATSLTGAGSMFGSSWSKLNAFTTFGGLTNLKIDLNLSPCPNLTKESLLNVFNEAADVTASPKTLTLGSTNLNKLTDEEKAIATNNGWTLA